MCMCGRCTRNVRAEGLGSVRHRLYQSRSQSPRSSVGGIVGLWENAEENQPLIDCLIISLTHSLLIEMRAILIIQEAKCKLVYLTRLFIALLTLQYRTMHSQAQYKLHNRKIYAKKLHNANYMQAFDDMFITNT